MKSRPVAVWVVAGVTLTVLILVGAALLLSWVIRAGAMLWLWNVVALAIVAEVLLLARRPEGRAWLRRWWWVVALQAVGIVIGVVGQIVR
jgi:hypothetical protein